MPSVNLRQLRERNSVLGRIVPIIPEKPVASPVEWPDFEARLKAIFGDRVLPAVEDLIEDRNSRW
jgi:hypothetical protein